VECEQGLGDVVECVGGANGEGYVGYGAGFGDGAGVVLLDISASVERSGFAYMIDAMATSLASLLVADGGMDDTDVSTGGLSCVVSVGSLTYCQLAIRRAPKGHLHRITALFCW